MSVSNHLATLYKDGRLHNLQDGQDYKSIFYILMDHFLLMLGFLHFLFICGVREYQRFLCSQ